jgi:hypothetical protein
MKRQLELFSKTKTIGSFERTYKNAPADVKKILDGLDFMEDYGKLEKARKALMKKGYYLDYGLDGAVTEFRKVRTAKKVGAYKKPVLFKPTKKQTAAAAQRLVKETMHKDTKSHNVNIKVVSGVNGSEYFAKQLNSLLADKKKLETDLMIYKQRVKEKVPFSPFNALHFKRLPGMIKSINIQIRESKKHIK